MCCLVLTCGVPLATFEAEHKPVLGSSEDPSDEGCPKPHERARHTRSEPSCPIFSRLRGDSPARGAPGGRRRGPWRRAGDASRFPKTLGKRRDGRADSDEAPGCREERSTGTGAGPPVGRSVGRREGGQVLRLSPCRANPLTPPSHHPRCHNCNSCSYIPANTVTRTDTRWGKQ